jgi:23S rRNA (pseudouridine1915-N3)-methyltransferase
MKFRFIVFESKNPDWVTHARNEYILKMRGFMPFDLELIKSPKLERESAELKRRKEAEMLLKKLTDGQRLILFDESGKPFARSEDFARELGKRLELGKSEILFCIGGAYGFDPSVQNRAEARWSLSGLTMNHWVAQIMALEQLYRGMTILKSIPYHNR